MENYKVHYAQVFNSKRGNYTELTIELDGIEFVCDPAEGEREWAYVTDDNTFGDFDVRADYVARLNKIMGWE